MIGARKSARHHLDRGARSYARAFRLRDCVRQFKILVQSDVTNIPEFFLRNPDWDVVFDVDPEQAQKTRHNSTTWRRRRRPRSWASTFLPVDRPCRETGHRYRLVPIAWNPVI